MRETLIVKQNRTVGSNYLHTAQPYVLIDVRTVQKGRYKHGILKHFIRSD
jgi:hypothetical protein